MKGFILLFVVITFISVYANAYVSVPAIFSDNMVLQQNTDVSFWGWAKPGEEVHITADWTNEDYSVKADNQGTWKILFPTPAAGGPYEIAIQGYNRIDLKNVLIGEVWLCSGQSNMEWTPNAGITNQEEAVKNAKYPNIRLFSVANATAYAPQNHLTGQWKETTPETMADFSAVGYFFAQQLHEKLGVPVGVINSSWGGTPAEAWIPEDVIRNNEALVKAADLQKPVPWGPVEPGRLFNAMIAPLVPFRIAGVLWYQGEGNTINADDYEELLTALITSWRDKWNDQFPFYFAQIAPYKYGDSFHGVIVRDEQRRTLKVPKTGMVITSDIGDTTDIHPRNKKDVGLRFAAMALNRHYDKNSGLDSGPLFKSMKIQDGKAVIDFDYAEGLHSENKNLTGFEVSDNSGTWYPAKARIKGDHVIVWSENIKSPENVRFAWRNTATPDLKNKADLPASSFVAK